MSWWPWLIVAGVIFILAILILVWIIVTSNKLVVLKNAIDRNFPVMNSKIKQYCEVVNLMICYVEKKSGKTKGSENLTKRNKECLATEGMVNRALAQRALAEKVKTFVISVKGKEEFKKSKKFLQYIKDINEFEEALANSISKYNDCVDKYNKKRNSFPANMIASRFKFEEKKSWNMKKD